MSEAINIVLGIVFGICSTSMLHLAKAMERHGIEVFSRDKSLKEKGKKPIIYVVGLVLNNLVFVWQFLGLSFASAAVFSSVFGIGLIILMLYSHFILHENIQKPELMGAILIIIGTTTVGVLYIIEPAVVEEVNYTAFFMMIIVLAVIFVILIGFSWKTGIATALIFGVVAGTLGGMDNTFKRMGLKDLGLIDSFIGVFSLEINSFIFLLSFACGGLAFLFTQIGFAKGADASRLVPFYNSFYIIGPVIFEVIIFPGATISVGKFIAMGIIVAGIFLMNLFKSPEELMPPKLEVDQPAENITDNANLKED